MKTRLILSALILAIGCVMLSGCSDKETSTGTEQIVDGFTENKDVTDDNPQTETLGSVSIALDFEKQSGHASNQFAIWVENAAGEYVRTVYATDYTVRKGFKTRPDSIPTWVEKSRISEMEDSEIDAISGPTPKENALSYTWDLTDSNGNIVPPGEYHVFVEGSLRWKNRVLYSGTITVGGEPAQAQVETEFFFEESDKQPALTESDPESQMITNVVINYTPSSATLPK